MRGVGDTVPDIEELEEDDGERDTDELTLEDADTDEQEVKPMVTVEDRDTATVTDMVRDIRELRVRLSVCDRVGDADALRQSVPVTLMVRLRTDEYV